MKTVAGATCSRIEKFVSTSSTGCTRGVAAVWTLCDAALARCSGGSRERYPSDVTTTLADWAAVSRVAFDGGWRNAYPMTDSPGSRETSRAVTLIVQLSGPVWFVVVTLARSRTFPRFVTW